MHNPKTDLGCRMWLEDYPWPYNDRRETRKDNPQKKAKFGIGVERRYSSGTMSAEELLDLGRYIEPLTCRDAYRFSWITGPRLPLGIECVETAGFEYKTIAFAWTKLYRVSGSPFAGPGRYTFSNVELCLLGVRGKPWHSSKGFRPQQVLPDHVVDVNWEEVCDQYGFDPRLAWDTSLQAPHPHVKGKIIHSRKPPEVIQALSKWFPDTMKIELFATENNPDPTWLCLGHEISGKDIRQDLCDLRISALNAEFEGTDYFADRK